MKSERNNRGGILKDVIGGDGNLPKLNDLRKTLIDNLVLNNRETGQTSTKRPPTSARPAPASKNR